MNMHTVTCSDISKDRLSRKEASMKLQLMPLSVRIHPINSTFSCIKMKPIAYFLYKLNIFKKYFLFFKYVVYFKLV